MQRIFCLIIVILLAHTVSLAQTADITGLWKGTLYNDSTRQFYKYEIGISKEKDKYTGFSHTWFLLDDKQYYGVKKLKIKVANDGKIVVEDDGLIANNYPVSPSKNVRQLNILTLNAESAIMELDGPFSTNRTKEYAPLTGHVTLQRKNDFWQSALVPHLQELGKENELSFVKEEENGSLAQKQEKASAEKQNASLAKVAAEKAAAEKATELKLKDAEEKRIAAATANQLKLKQAEEKRIAAEKEALAIATAKAEKEALAKKLQEEKEAAAAEQARELAAQKELIKKQQEETRLAKQLADAKTAAEKEKAKELLAIQQQQMAEQAKKDKLLKDQAIKAAEEKAAADKLAARDALAKKQAQEKAESEAKALADKKAAEEMLAQKKADEKVKEEKQKADLAAAKKSAVQQADNKVNDIAGSSAPAAKVNERTTVLQQTVSFSSDSLQLSLYDNGEVDGDTVSVLLNGEIILAKQGLSTTAIKKTIYIPAGTDKIELVMYAESLGSIPPNTGLLVVRDGKSLYEVRFSGDLQKNASIVFNRKKE